MFLRTAQTFEAPLITAGAIRFGGNRLLLLSTSASAASVIAWKDVETPCEFVGVKLTPSEALRVKKGLQRKSTTVTFEQVDEKSGTLTLFDILQNLNWYRVHFEETSDKGLEIRKAQYNPKITKFTGEFDGVARLAKTEIGTLLSHRLLGIFQEFESPLRGRKFNEKEIARVKRGVSPGAMEDKWIIQFRAEEKILHFARSWSRLPVYRMHFANAEDFEISKVERILPRNLTNDPPMYWDFDWDFENQVLKFLMDRIVLGNPVKFTEHDHPRSLEFHHYFGWARNQDEIPPRKHPITLDD